MKLFFCGLEYDRYDQKLGYSFEYINFYKPLTKMPGVESIFCSFQDILTLGKQRFNDMLLARVHDEKPDLVFVFMYTDEFSPETLRMLRRMTTTLGWFSDDHWRFDNYSRHYAPYFSWVATTHSQAPDRYRAIGQKNVIRSQWFCNPDAYTPLSIKKDIAVSFAGLKNRGRAHVVAALQSAGISMSVFGNGWEGGKLPQEELIRLFSRSSINVNMVSPRSLWEPRSFGRLFARRSLNTFVSDFRVVDNVRSWLNARILQIKARPFEIAACGGFCISGYADDFDSYYKENEEMIFYRATDDLIEKTRYYLAHDVERERIAQAGYERTLKEHTCEKRFGDIFKAIGIPYGTV